MPHFPRPFFRGKRNLWYVELDGRQINLGPDAEEAHRRYGELIEARKKNQPVQAKGTGILVSVALEKFLDWCQQNRAPRTYEWYAYRLSLFARSLEKSLTVEKLKPFHLDEVLGQYRSWSSTTKHSVCRAVQRALRWAEKRGYIDKSPLRDYEKPAPRSRTRVIEPAEFEEIIRYVPSPSFADLLIASWETGARPQEILAVEARHVDLANVRWVFPADESKGEKWPRIVYLSAKALEITRRLIDRHPEGWDRAGKQSRY